MATRTRSKDGGAARSSTRTDDSVQPALMDVWSRSGSRHRVRAVVLLAANVVLFTGLCTFAFWIRSGQVLAPTTRGYWDVLATTFSTGKTGISLGSVLVEPISVLQVPVQIPILGLLMAALIAIPILTAILYRFWSCLPFVAAVGFLAVMPWLAITLLGSCILASVRPFRGSFRFTSALLGLVPCVLYLILASSGTDKLTSGIIDPVDRMKFIAPWVLALVAATLVFAVVLTLAKLVNYRPGAVTPLLVMMFALPVALFEYRVGRDELYYRLLEAKLRWEFEARDTSLQLEKAVERRYLTQPLPKRPYSEIREQVEQMWLVELASDLEPRRTALRRHKQELVDACDRFLKHYPSSRYVFNVLYLKGRSLDTRVCLAEFRRTKWVRFYDDFPSPESRQTWMRIIDHEPRSDVLAVALLRVAQLDARRGDLDRAKQKLSALLRRFDPDGSGTARTLHAESKERGVFERGAPEEGLHVPIQRTVVLAHGLLDLVVANRDPLYGNDPIGVVSRPGRETAPGLLGLDPRQETYVQDLRDLKRRFPRNCQLEDNIDLQIAKATPVLALKIKRLERCLDRFAGRDAAPESLLRLGDALRQNGESARAQEQYDRLVRDFPDSIWAIVAGRYARFAVAPMPKDGDG